MINTLLVSILFFLPFGVVFLLVIAARHIFPGFFRMKLGRILNGTLCAFGALLPLILFTAWAAGHDIYKDYVSESLLMKFETYMPGWCSADVHACPLEWSALQISLLLFLVFHMLLFARFLVTWENRRMDRMAG